MDVGIMVVLIALALGFFGVMFLIVTVQDWIKHRKFDPRPFIFILGWFAFIGWIGLTGARRINAYYHAVATTESATIESARVVRMYGERPFMGFKTTFVKVKEYPDEEFALSGERKLQKGDKLNVSVLRFEGRVLRVNPSD